VELSLKSARFVVDRSDRVIAKGHHTEFEQQDEVELIVVDIPRRYEPACHSLFEVLENERCDHRRLL
jgi:hypothetical protein